MSSQKLNAGGDRPCGPVLSSYQEEPLPGLSDGLQTTSLAYSRENTGTEGSRNSLTPLPADTGALEKGRISQGHSTISQPLTPGWKLALTLSAPRSLSDIFHSCQGTQC